MKTIPFDTTEGFDIAQWASLSDVLQDLPDAKWEIVIRKPVRTTAQNSALHLYCEWLAVKFNENHFLFTEHYFGKEFEREWDADMVKNSLFKRVLKAQCGKTSTAKATTKEISDVVDYLEKNLSLKMGIDIAFPDRWRLEEENLQSSK